MKWRSSILDGRLPSSPRTIPSNLRGRIRTLRDVRKLLCRLSYLVCGPLFTEKSIRLLYIKACRTRTSCDSLWRSPRPRDRPAAITLL